MKFIEDFRDRILDEVHPVLAETVTEHWVECNKMTEDLNSNPEELEDYFTRTQASIVIITHPVMKKVWSKVNSFRHQDLHSDDSFFWESSNYLENILRALDGGSYWEKLTPKVRNREYQELVDSLTKVASTLEKIGYHDPVLEFIGEQLFPLQVKFFDQLKELNHETARYYYKIPELLNRYAEALQTEQRHQKVLIDRPNSDDARVSYFARNLYTAHQRDFNTPLYKTISVIAGIFYPDHDTSYEKIRASIRSMK